MVSADEMPYAAGHEGAPVDTKVLAIPTSNVVAHCVMAQLLARWLDGLTPEGVANEQH
jgi:hypothetical protein